MRMLMLLSAAALVGAPAIAQMTAQNQAAQTQPTQTQPVETPADAAISAGTAPSTAAANAQVAGQANVQQAVVEAVNLDAQAQYAADMAQYEADLRANHREAVRDEVRWHRQQRAYADAMADWRRQVAACKAGNERACRAPTPNPAAYL